MDEPSNIRSIDWYRKHGTKKKNELDEPVEESFDFGTQFEANKKNEERLAKERNARNKNLVRNFRLNTK